MSKHDARASVSANPQTGERSLTAREIPRFRSGPLSVLVVGDFSGAAGAARADSWAVFRVEHPDELMERLEPRLEIDGVSLELRQLEDFHPDRLLDRFPPLRDRVSALTARPTTDEDTAPQARAPDVDAPSGGAVLDDILAATPEAASPLEQLDDWVRKVVTPHTAPADHDDVLDPESEPARSAAAAVRKVLHNPSFRRMEATWRDLAGLANAVGQADGVRLYALDVTRDTLEGDVAGHDPESSRLLRVLLEPMAGTETQAAIVLGAFQFGPSPRDQLLLNRLAMIASVAGTPWVGAAETDLVGITDISTAYFDVNEYPEPELWREFRTTTAARALALVTPRVMARSAYGANWEPSRALPGFEEVEEPADTDQFLWGSGAFLSVRMIVERFGREKWDFDPGRGGVVPGLPIHPGSDGSLAVHATERLVTRPVAEHIEARGVMPIRAHVAEASAIVPGLRAAAPGGILEAWWNGARSPA